MCCDNYPPSVRKLLKSGKEKIIAYKVYGLGFNEKGKKYLYSAYQDQIVDKPGIVISNSKRQKPCFRNIDINNGIHVYWDKNSVDTYYYKNKGFNCVFVPVICEIKDLIACGEWNDIVFKKVTISKNAWKNATKKNIIE